MMFVGDSLDRGQYVSMSCLLRSLLPKDAKSMETFDSLTVFKAKDYNASIEFFLLESNADNAVIHRITDRVIRRGLINKHGRYWKGVEFSEKYNGSDRRRIPRVLISDYVTEHHSALGSSKRCSHFDLQEAVQSIDCRAADCDHWCLPGLQDTWNELLYTKLFFP